ncbi:uncharacterized protein N7479_005063 [Penicillium vulpinum]|uniref:Uncharacterized protein n=1 Tax=Penicillium vulpinum TaxID=29845 RepID=A0A1V6RMY3_9EURO|nr:uncharacterized protein N7479_005063 [Penicillium vulpinum]KAJ5965187.1 hypothetical protein N7479_005063 [Penicillium vulpinum]OQE02980.1 hypothetical protein PENVUL_c036G06553 [Penicillium vulpinum]
MELNPRPPVCIPRGDIENILLLPQDQQQEPNSHTASESDTISSPTNIPDTSTALPGSPLAARESFCNLTKMLFLLLLHGADTLMFIDPSPETIRSKLPLSVRTVPHRIHSEKLLGTGSAYFKQLFSPQMQTRTRKRRRLTGKLPDGIQYVLDLTPPTMDEDAVIFLTELSCPMSIRMWASKQDMWSLPWSCIGGQDDLESFEQPTQFPTTSPEPQGDIYVDHLGDLRTEQIEASFESQDQFPASQPEIVEQKGLPVEYSASRHREGIEHILHVLEGLNPRIDTPCKLWTFFALAKIFDVAAVPAICDHIISWFYQLNNIRFIELHPDVTYRVACGIGSSCLCRDAFVAMVGDEALLYLIRTTHFKPVGSMKILAQSRVSDVLDDTEVQRIEYASKSFGDYVIRCFLHLAGSKMPWLAQIVEFQKLTRHLQLYPADQETICQLVMTLKEFIRDHIYGALVKARDTNRSFHVAPSLVRSENPYYRWGIDKGFVLQRLIGKNFWSALVSLDLCQDEAPRMDSYSSIAEIGNGLLAFGGETAARIRHVSSGEVRQMIHVFNQVVRTRAQGRQEEEALAARHAGGHAVMEMTINVRKSQSDNEVGSTSNNGPFLNPIPAPTPSPYFPPVSSMPPKTDISTEIFHEKTFKDELHSFLRQYALEMLQQPDPPTMRHELTDTLTCLTYNEFQYLPLWAGGNDDGTGGVFTDLIIPAMDIGGFSGPGPAVHTGSVASTNGSFSEVEPSDTQSTIYGASHNATYSHASDIMSVDSTDYSQSGLKHEDYESHDEAQPETYMEMTEYDDEISSLGFGPTTDDEEYVTQSNGTIMMDMGSPEPSFAGISENIHMDKVEDEGNDTEFEFVAVHDYF